MKLALWIDYQAVADHALHAQLIALMQLDDLALSQEDTPRTHKMTHQISRELAISQRSVGRIIYEDLQLKCLKKCRAQELTAVNCRTRLDRSRQVLRKYPSYAVDFIFFTDEKVFTVAP